MLLRRCGQNITRFDPSEIRLDQSVERVFTRRPARDEELIDIALCNFGEGRWTPTGPLIFVDYQCANRQLSLASVARDLSGSTRIAIGAPPVLLGQSQAVVMK